MIRILIGFMTFLLFCNCNKKDKKSIEKNKPYIISYENEKLNKYFDSLKKNSNTIAIPLKGFYGENQLLIDKHGDFYYYQNRHIGIGCGTGKENDTLPHFLNLQPKDILKIPQASVSDFLSENILNKEKNRQILIIASQNDTITNTSFFNFINENKLQAYTIRRTTQEEDTVLKYKKNNNSYFSDEIKWDHKRITLPFIKPILKHK